MFKVFIMSLLSFCLISALFAQGGKKISKTFDAKKKVSLSVASGDCIVKTGSGDKILVDVVYDVTPEDSFKPEFSESGNKLKIKEKWYGSSRGSVTWTLTVPEKTEVEYSSASGDLSLSGISAKIDANTASGDISMDDASGEFECSTASGDVSVESSKGEFEISTASGDVDAYKISGELEMSTASGEIKVSDASGSFDLSCASGDIEAKGITIEDEGSFSTASGDVEVKLAETPDADVSLSAASGDISLDYDGNELKGYFEFTSKKSSRISAPYDFDTEEEFERHGTVYLKKTFTRGSSQPVINLSTSSGRVTLKK